MWARLLAILILILGAAAIVVAGRLSCLGRAQRRATEANPEWQRRYYVDPDGAVHVRPMPRAPAATSPASAGARAPAAAH